MDDDDWFTLEEWSTRLGGLVWVERTVAELADQWSRIEAVPTVSVHLRTLGRHHAWHAEMVESCLPTSPQLLEPDPIRPPTPGWEQCVAVLDGLDDPDATTTRLRALVRVTDPWLDREIEALLDLARPISDAAIARWLRFTAIDHHDDGERTRDLLAAAASRSPVSMEEHQLLARLDLR